MISQFVTGEQRFKGSGEGPETFRQTMIDLVSNKMEGIDFDFDSFHDNFM